MDRLLGAILVGITSYVATSLDDMVVTTIFFSQISPTFRRRHVVLGKYLGFVILILASLPGYFGGLVISKAWIGLLGLLPIGVGLSHLLKKDASQTEVQEVSDDLTLDYGAFDKTSKQPVLKILLATQTYHVAAVTIANGGDNIGVYVPLFASSSFPRLSVIITVFLVLVGVGCILAEGLTRHPLIARALTRYGQRAMPFILIGLGLYILVDSGTLSLALSLSPNPSF